MDTRTFGLGKNTENSGSTKNICLCYTIGTETGDRRYSQKGGLFLHLKNEQMICFEENNRKCAQEKESGCTENVTVQDTNASEISAETLVEAGLCGRSTAETLGKWGWERIFRRLRRDTVGVETLARETARLYIPEVWRQLLDMIRKGSVPAVRLYMELCRETGGGESTLREDGAIRELREQIFRAEESDGDN